MNIDSLRSSLQNCVQTVGQQNQFVMNRTVFNDARINRLIDLCFNGTAIIIDDAAVDVNSSDSSQVLVTGKGALFNVVGMAVEAIFWPSDEGVNCALRYILPLTWKFSQSFPNLPLTWEPPSTLTSSSELSCSILDLLTFADASFILSTQTYANSFYGVQISAGVNFACHLRMNGLLGLVEQALTIPDPFTLAGPIILPNSSSATDPLTPLPWPPTRLDTPLPGINLKAELSTDLSFESVKLQNVFIVFYSPLEEIRTGISYSPGLFLGGTLQIGDHFSVEVVAKKMFGDDNLVLNGLFDGLTLPNLQQFADLVGGDDLLNSLVPSDSMPSFLEEDTNLSIQAISLTITCSPFSISSIGLVVALEDSLWYPQDSIKVENLTAYFNVYNPLKAERSIRVLLSGTLGMGGLSLNMSASFPTFEIKALLPQGCQVSLKSLLAPYISDLPGVGDLIVDGLYLEVQPSQGFSLATTLADTPQPWSIEIGSETLTLSNMQFSLTYARNAGFSGSLQGSIALAGVQLDVDSQFPGPLTLRSQFPSLSLKTLLTHICGDDLDWPANFDLDLEQSYVLFEEQNGNLSLSVAGEVKDLGFLAVKVQRQDKWGFALGMDLSFSALATLPGLGALAPLGSFVGVESLLLVLSSLDQQTGFQFPDTAQFNVPTLSNRLTLPAQASGLVRGLNFYASLSTSKSQGFTALTKYLGVSLDGTIGMTLAVSLPDPVTNSKFFLSVHEEIQKGTTLDGELGVLLQGSSVGVFLSAVVKTQVQGQPLEIDVVAAVLESGVLISGTMPGTISFQSLKLSNLALIIGIDFEGVPSLGIAATLDVGRFDAALALFFDSTDPAKSLVAGALSNITLRDIAQSLAAQEQIPGEIADVLGAISLKELQAFSVPSSVATSLDHRDLATIASAFKQYGAIALPATSDRVHLIVNQQGKVWHITDMSTMKHYSLTLQGNAITVSLQPQLYVAPQPTFIGNLRFEQGFTVVARIDFLMIQAQINVQINVKQGILADVKLAPITLLNHDFFSITGAGGQGGPQFSLATYKQPLLTDPQMRDPHLLLSGNLRLLGVDMAGIYLLVGRQGLTIKITAQVNPILHVDLNGALNSLTTMKIGGALLVGINHTLNLNNLGTISVNTTVNGSLDAGYRTNTAFANFRGSFVFQGITCNIPSFALATDGKALQVIGDMLWAQVSDILNKLLKSADQWLTWVQSGVIQNAGRTAEEVGKVLVSVYQLSATDIASKAQKILHYGITDLVRALKGAGKTANEAVAALKSLGFSASEIASAIAAVFTQTHADVVVDHIDTPAGPHGDVAAKHIDIPKVHIDSSTHVDVPRVHTDGSKHVDIPHGDIPVVGTVTPHGDSNPHIDQTITPHGDTNTHLDQVTTPHGDSTTPHADGYAPPHGDTSTHIDVKA